MADAENDRLAQLEARVEALNAALAGLLSTLVLHGVVNRAAVDSLLSDAAGHASATAGAPQVEALRRAVPAAMRDAMGPPPGPDDHDH